MNKQDLLHIKDLATYDDLAEDKKLEAIIEFINYKLKPKDKPKTVWLSILDYRTDMVLIKEVSSEIINMDEYVDNMFRHSDYYYLCSDKPLIMYNDEPLHELIENLRSDIEAGNFDLDNDCVDKESYERILKL